MHGNIAGRERGRSGATYAEVLLATAFVALLLASVIDALSAGVESAELHLELAETHYHLSSLFEETLAQPFEDLDAEALAAGSPSVATAYSDAVGATRRRLVYLARYDADDADGDGNPFTGGEDGLLWVRVELEYSHRALETLTAR